MGRRRDSYWPARKQKIMNTPRPKMIGAKLPAIFSR